MPLSICVRMENECKMKREKRHLNQMEACPRVFVSLELVDLGSDAVHVTTTLRRQLASTVGIFLHQSHLLQSLKNSSGNGLGSPHEVTGSGAVALPGAVDLGEGTDAGRGADVQVAGDGGGAHEEPVGIVRPLLVEAGQLDEIRPLGDLHLARLLEEVGESDDELLLIHIFHARHFFFLIS